MPPRGLYRAPPACRAWRALRPGYGLAGTVVLCMCIARILTSANLSGTITSAIGGLTELIDLYLNYNRLTGSIPSSISKLNKLDLLNLDHNFLTGSIPVSLVEMTKLSLLHLCCNNLTGQIPSNISNMRNLSILSVTIGPIWPHLRMCLRVGALLSHESGMEHEPVPPPTDHYCHNSLSHGAIIDRNGFTGPIPSLVSLRRLQKIQLGYNKLSGEPDFIYEEEIYYMPDLYVIDISYNNLTGPFPDQLSADLRPPGSAGFQVINLAGNRFWGPVKGNFTGASKLRKFDISNNQLGGGFPKTLLSLLASTGLRYVDVSGNYLLGPLPNVSLPGVNVFTANNCFQPPAAWQRSVAFCKALPPPQCFDFRFHFPGPCDIENYLGVDYNHTNVDPLCYDSECHSGIAPPFDNPFTRCSLQAHEEGSLCYDFNKRTAYSYQCADSVCRAGKCTFSDVIQSRINQSCNMPWSVDSSWNMQCLDVRCASNGSCLVMAFRDTDTACKVTGTNGCSGVFCNGKGVCNLTRNATDGAKCLLPDNYSTHYLADCRESSCNGSGFCNVAKNYSDGTLCSREDVDYEKGVCTEFSNKRTICTPPPTLVRGPYPDDYYFAPTPIDPCLPYVCDPGSRTCSSHIRSPNHTLCDGSDMCSNIYHCSGYGGCDTSVPPQTAADGSRCDENNATGCQYKTCMSGPSPPLLRLPDTAALLELPRFGPALDYCAWLTVIDINVRCILVCRSSACQVVNNVPDGTFCNDFNPNAVDSRCQISSCRNGTCSVVVRNKPAGTVCLPTSNFLVGSLMGYQSNYVTGTCESAECCARCDGAGHCDNDIREGQGCRNCTNPTNCGGGPNGCDPYGCVCRQTSCLPFSG
eukprot:SM000107S14080  [mRNA]  locus=s107:465534:474135:+ [translate_table: standard]